jgi:cytochrome c-type biogenesis protein CcmH
MRAWFFLLISMISISASAQNTEARYEHLAHELRCLVCQNQSLAESSADLAEDLKREVKGLIAQGKSDQEIKIFLSARYGDFILFKPPVQSNTLILWYAPFAALLAGAAVLFFVLKKRRFASKNADFAPQVLLTDAERAELDARLK